MSIDPVTPRRLDLNTRPHPLEKPERPEKPETDREGHNAFATHRDPSITEPEATKDDPVRRRLQWVRPTDAAARGGAVVLERGAVWNRQLHDLVGDALRDGRTWVREQLARRGQQLEDTTQTSATRSAVARQGVSR